ncbi:AAA family ATPase [Fodinicurvata halophila]|uniref:AAA family ATPase n=1 Tax=Fodinicurvata halophila TaxID=1419723 RepID=A0ABV8UGH0_9PROT
MPVEKIILIKNIGRFRDARASGDVKFKKYNVVFAENGRGKTTVCAILRALRENQPAYITGRKTLAAIDAPEVQIRLNGTTATFSNGTWNQTDPHLAVFDGQFVTENVYAGDAVEPEQRRNLYRVMVGPEGVGMVRRMDELDKENRQKSREIREIQQQINEHVPQDMTFDDFLNLAEDPEIATKIEDQERAVQAAQRADQIQQRAELRPVDLPRLPNDFTAVLVRTLEGIAADAEEKVKQQIAKHQMHDRGEAWLSEGLNYIHEEDDCPFCGQSLDRIDLIDAYRAYFSEEYEQLKSEISNLMARVDAELGEQAFSAVERTVHQNSTDLEFWQQYVTIAPPAIDDLVSLIQVLRDLRQAALSLLERKAAAPLDSISPSEAYTQAKQDYSTATESITRYNEYVNAANRIIRDKKEEVAGTDLQAARSELDRRKAVKTRYTNRIRQICDLYVQKNSEKRQQDEEKEQLRSRIDDHTNRIISTYQQSINNYLDRFNAGFRITGTSHSYQGGTPTTHYQLLINDTPINLGRADTSLETPSFKNTLSAGDRSTLALAFFLAQLEQDPDRASKSVVLDDPFTSQDSFRRNQTALQVRRLGDVVAQVIVLSHDIGFLKLVWDKLAATASHERKSLWLARVAEGNTRIAEWDIEEAVKDRFEMSRDALQRFYSFNEGNAGDVIQKIRPVLEAYYKAVAWGVFQGDDTLGVMVGKIRDLPGDHELRAVEDELEEINEYCRSHSHGEAPGGIAEPIDDGELQAYVKKTLRLVGSF